MPGDADFIQKVVHMLEAGKMAVCVKRSLGGVASATLGFYPLYYFLGLATSQAMVSPQFPVYEYHIGTLN